MAQLVPVEGRFDAQEGDWAVVDHEGTIDGQPFEGSKAEGVTVKVAAGAVFRGLPRQLDGKKLGETVEHRASRSRTTTGSRRCGARSRR